MSLQDELISHYKRFTDPNLLCDECGLSPVSGELQRLIILKTPLMHLVYLVCDECAEGDTPMVSWKTEAIKRHLISEPAVTIMRPAFRESVQ